MRACPKSNFISHSTGAAGSAGKEPDAIFPDKFISSNKCILFEQISDLYFFPFISSLSLSPGRFGQLK
jgi:hypothetical protein